MSRNPESLWQEKVVKAMTKRGAYVMRCASASVAGTADLVACFKGRFIWVEVKTPTGAQSAKQKLEALRVKKADGYTMVCHDWDDLAILMLLFDELSTI